MYIEGGQGKLETKLGGRVKVRVHRGRPGQAGDVAGGTRQGTCTSREARASWRRSWGGTRQGTCTSREARASWRRSWGDASRYVYIEGGQGKLEIKLGGRVKVRVHRGRPGQAGDEAGWTRQGTCTSREARASWRRSWGNASRYVSAEAATRLYHTTTARSHVWICTIFASQWDIRHVENKLYKYTVHVDLFLSHECCFCFVLFIIFHVI